MIGESSYSYWEDSYSSTPSEYTYQNWTIAKIDSNDLKYDWNTIWINSKDELSTLMNTELENYRIDTSLDILELKLKEIHSRNKIKKSTKHSTPDKMHDANKAFDNYMETLSDPNSNEDIVNERSR